MQTIATTENGKLEGKEREGVLLFAGIPYAQPPVGPLRFSPPAPADSWSGVLDATQFGNAAPQLAGGALTDAPPKRMGEDCLSLNVTTPGLDDRGRAVMVWVHGGAFRTGQGGIPWYNGASFAARGDIVTVSINYRLGALGFANFSDLGEGAKESGALGILDQIAALEWVRDNIAAFGGDPQRVTVAGESAGAMSVGALLGCKRAAGLFQQAIAQSGAAHHTLAPETAGFVSTRFRELIGAHDLDALRALSVEGVLDGQKALELSLAGEVSQLPARVAAIAGMPFQPSHGGDLLPTRPIESLRGGLSREIPVLIGTNRHETTLWGVGDMELRDFEKLAERHFDEPSSAIAAYQRALPEGTARDWHIALATDELFRVPALRLSEALAANGGRSYQYLFSFESRAFGGRLGATHALEIPFVFNNLSRAGVDAFLGEGPRPQPLADAMHAAWTAFINTGEPRCDEIPRWPEYRPDRRQVMEFGDRIGLQEDPDAETLPLWEGLR